MGEFRYITVIILCLFVVLLVFTMGGCIYVPATRLATVNSGVSIGASANASYMREEPYRVLIDYYGEWHDYYNDVDMEVDSFYYNLGLWGTYGHRSNPEARGYDVKLLYFYRSESRFVSPIHNFSAEGRLQFTRPESPIAISSGLELAYHFEPRYGHHDFLMGALSIYVSGNNLSQKYRQGKPLFYSRLRAAAPCFYGDLSREEPRDISLTLGIRFGTDRLPVYIETQMSPPYVFGLGAGIEYRFPNRADASHP